MSLFESTIPEESPAEAGQVEQGTEGTQESSPVEGQEEAAQGAQTEQQEGQQEGQQQEVQQEVQQEQPQFDYVKAYAELRKDYTRKAQELANYRRQQPQQMQQNPAPTQGQGAGNDAFWAAMQGDPTGTIANIAQQYAAQMVAPIYEQQAMNTLGKSLEAVGKDYPQIADPKAMQTLFSKVSEIAQEVGNPQLAQYPTQRILKLAAQELYGDRASAVYQQAKKAGQEETLNNIRQKQGLSVNAGVKPQQAQKTIEDQIADSIVSAGRRPGIFG
jgi:hypothetical protein